MQAGGGLAMRSCLGALDRDIRRPSSGMPENTFIVLYTLNFPVGVTVLDPRHLFWRPIVIH
jgi:hypothetical protein